MKMTAGGPMMRAAKQFAGRTAITTPQGSQTFAELNAAANRVGSGLRAVGLEPGERVGVLSHNRMETVQVWLGLERFQLPRLTMHSHFDMAVHLDTLGKVRPAALVFDTAFTSAVEQRRGELSSVRHFIAMGANPPPWATPLEQVMARGSPEDPQLDVDETAPCIVQPTTGTTGLPKPWIISYRGWSTLVSHNLHHLDTFGPGIPQVGPDDVNLHLHALQWASGAQTMYPYLLRGARNVILDDSGFDPVKIVETIEREQVTGVFIPGPMLIPLLDVIEARGGIKHRLRRAVLFFASPELLERFTRVVGPMWCHGFGSTEQGAPSARLLQSEAAEKPGRLHSVGRPASWLLEMAVVDEQGHRLPPGQVGELVVRSPMSASEYWEDPERTRSSFLPGGWFRPADIGHMDEDGFFYYLDRAKDRIRTARGVVYPHVVEVALLRHPAVANCGVVGVGAPGSEQIVAAVLLKPGQTAGEPLRREIEQAAHPGLKEHERPGRLVFLTELPTVLGGAKVQREVLRQRLEQAS
ncbi:MAG: class I adenylate-forming enzyme family protein [Hyalangium sp.]|uniref:class I adenylate-forming enzyme family protein n=1 Tax=Hyalangium sp. TaxID=2028555 RepID=UPI00389B0487